MKLKNETYDVLKWISLIALDALGICYKTLSSVWGWPYGEQILETCTALSLCIGALIGISTAEYRKEQLERNNKGE